MKRYAIRLELSGPSAIWTRPDTCDSPVSYPAPTYSAVKGIFESILWIQAVNIIPRKVEICSPIAFHGYQTNYGGPLRKAESVKNDNPYQLLATVLVNTCYRMYAHVERNELEHLRFSEKTRQWRRSTTCPEHAYQEIFNRRLSRGQSFTIPFLGWREFAPDSTVSDSYSLAAIE
ncbi:MAG TPA: CRISPR-associated protein Cas5 [Lamprocystis sp. (in: g-proteobacteria)]|nr:CRISPR-associated protein Cas5 [Lamprocystis sp. (in: g-proteobacteria)]